MNILLFAHNPFFQAYREADILGKLIFISLICVSIITWVLLIYKICMTRKVNEMAKDFRTYFEEHKQHPLNVDYSFTPHREFPHAFYNVYLTLRAQTVNLLKKNHRFSHCDSEEKTAFLSPADIDAVESQVVCEISMQKENLEKYLYILSTIVSLAPFLGLLGTVWGILSTFSELQGSGGNNNQMILTGLSLALTTTVLGLITAIPALIGYNYLKQMVHRFQTEMENFSSEVLSTIELNYRKVD
jgi:biopolymer transport protein TolQ